MPERPNVLLICTDHWGGPLLGAAGHPVVMTPTIDQLARCGVRYSNAYSACPSCIAARMSLMTGMSPRRTGLRTYIEGTPFPEAQTLAQCFRGAGYQAYAVGKMHVTPQRNRVGFDDVMLEEQGRHLDGLPDGGADDWELYLAEHGYAGQEYAAGMPTNDFTARAWHLPERFHQVNWAAREMCRFIRRRDPRKPGFWYLSFSCPHPPVVPPQAYLDLYRDVPVDEPATGEWSRDWEKLPYQLKRLSNQDSIPMTRARRHEWEISRRAFYATLTHIDHQIRVVLGTLNEARLIDNTIIVFTSDHGHMVGEHGLWCMTPFYEMSASMPLIVVPAKGDTRLAPGTTDARIAEFADIMPTLLDLAGLPIPEQVDRLSLIRPKRREYLYGEHWLGDAAMRMIRAGRYKLIYYATGNRAQLFDIEADPRECRDLAGDREHAGSLAALRRLLVENLYGEDLGWLRDGELVGLPDRPYVPAPDRRLRSQRGLRFM